MASGYHGITAGEKPPAATVNDYWSKQVVMVFATTADRDTQLSGVLREGMHCFILNLNVEQVYTGSTWSTIGPVHGALTVWVPVVTQSTTPVINTTTGSNYATYSRVGRRIFFELFITVTSGSGTLNNAIVVTLPVTAAHGSGDIGTGYLYDSSVPTYVTFNATLLSTTTLSLTTLGAVPSVGASGNSYSSQAVASGDVITISGSYEAAADA